MDKALNLIGLMRKANRISLTEEKCREDIKAGRSALVIIASDCSDAVKEKISGLAAKYDVKYLISNYTKLDLASAAGSGLCSVASVNDRGFSEAFLKIIET